MKISYYRAELPYEVDAYVYGTYNADFRPQGDVFVVKNWSMEKTLEYLGTYFPRSFAESYCIFLDYFEKNKDAWSKKETLRIFDLGCGCGGNLLGVLCAAGVVLPCMSRIEVRAIDGNPYGVQLCREIMETYFGASWARSFCRVDYVSFSNAEQLRDTLRQINTSFDIVMAFKALNEVLTCGYCGASNPYKQFLVSLLPYISDDGIACIADLATTIKLMDCPRCGGEGVGCAEMLGRGCRVKEVAEFLVGESNNNWAKVLGECAHKVGENCPFGYGGVVPESRVCPIKLSNVYYRDLIRSATFDPNFRLVHDNLDANRLGHEAEKTFYVSHSKASNDESHLFWAILQKQVGVFPV